MPAGSASKAADDDLQAAITKSNAYTGLMNRTLRAIQSWERYGSWVDMKKGPTGKERYITYGLYSLYDV
ncbi:MAG: YiiG family protein, partial [Proteobacteria bacterium]|nr:YiiG family protein [Pseudomonadota bacterium]